MKSTNAIEKAIKKKIDTELQLIVNSFLNEVQTKLKDKYNTANFYDFRCGENSTSFFVRGTSGLSTVLVRTLHEAHGDAMLKAKSKELIDKLDLI